MPDENTPQTPVPAEPTPPAESPQAEPAKEVQPPPEQEAPASPAPAETAPASGGKKILIIEDERPLAHALELKFTHEGYQTEIATNGAEGLQKAEAGGYSLILLDLIMPEMDGFTFMEKLQHKVPIIVLSNLGQEEDKKRALEMGAVAYFVKSNTPITEIITKAKESL